MHPFQVLFCEKFKCAPSEYEERVFRECLYRHARLLAPLMRRLSRHFFSEDFKFIGYLAQATDLRDALSSAADFQDSNQGHFSFLRLVLKVRVSGRKAAKLAEQLFAQQPEELSER